MSTTRSAAERELLVVIVIGAGRAGLALGHHLAGRDADLLLRDGAPEIGQPAVSSQREPYGFSPPEVDIGHDADGDEPSCDDVHGGAERGPPAGVGHESGAVLPEVFQAMTGQAEHE